MIAGIAITPASAQSSARVGNFQISRTPDPMDDHVSTVAAATGQSGLIALGLTCYARGYSARVMILWGRYLSGTNDRISVEVRIPPARSVAAAWSFIPKHHGAVMPDELVRPFVDAASVAPVVVVRVIDADGEIITDTIPVKGLEAAALQLPCTVGVR
jgi:hypothetical protein